MNKIQKIGAVLAAVALTAVATQVSAMSENWSAAVSRFLTLDGGTTGVPVGGLMKLGILSTSEAAFQSNQDNLSFVLANFNAWSTANVGDGSGLDGTFAAGGETPPGAGYFSTQLYLLVFNPGQTQVGLFSNASWISPASDAATANSLDLGDDGTYAVIGLLSSGTVTTPTDLAGGDAAALHLIPVPEPSSLMLIGLGLVGMVGLLRRRS